LRIILEVIDHRTDSISGRVNRADSPELLERRTRMRAAVDLNIFVGNGQFPVAALISRLVRTEDGCKTSKKKRYQSAENPPGQRRRSEERRVGKGGRAER